MKKYDHTWLIEEWERMGRPEIERYSNSWKQWNMDEDPKFIVYFQYRIKSKPWIDWDHVSDDILAMATDDDRDSGLFHGEPVKSSGWWHRDGEGFIVNPNIFASFTPGTCGWKDSLVMRPVVIGETK